MGIRRTMKPAQAKRRGSYFSCEVCGNEFYAYPSYIKRCEKRGTYPRFCSTACYQKTMEGGPFIGKHHSPESIEKMRSHPNRPRFGRGEDNPNFTRYGEDFVGKDIGWWRDKLFAEIGKCQRCGFSDHRALTVHHKDRNRSNNDPSNLELLCWNCHAIEHYDHKDGMYHFMRRKTVDQEGKRKRHTHRKPGAQEDRYPS